jgi:hypothetical protein
VSSMRAAREANKSESDGAPSLQWAPPLIVAVN